MATRTPAEAFPPGEFILEELEERGWTQTDLAEILGRTHATVSEIIKGKRAITPEMAVSLAAAFGTSPEYWLRLDQSYTLWRMTNKDDKVIARRASLYSHAPVSDIVRRGWIEASENIDVLEKRVLRFYDIRSLDELAPQIPYAARKSTSYANDTPAQQAWFARAKQLAKLVHAKPFSAISADRAITELKRLTHLPEEARHVPRVLSDCGIRFVVVQGLPGSRIDGACFWLTDGEPAIALSMRFDRIDNFWFTLFHEVAHCKHGATSIDIDLESDLVEDLHENERRANDFATTELIDQYALKSFIARKRPLYSTASVVAFARVNQTHPGIVVGQLQRRKEIGYHALRKLLVPIREYVIPSALTDGWGRKGPYS